MINVLILAIRRSRGTKSIDGHRFTLKFMSGRGRERQPLFEYVY